MIRRMDTVSSWTLLILLAFCLGPFGPKARAGAAKSAPQDAASIEVDAAKTIGKVSPYVFGQNIEYEHGTISGGEQNQNDAHGMHSGGLWAEMLRDRKFEEGDLDADGVANAWVPEERITNHYWELHGGQGKYDRYRIDHQEYYGGGAAQAIEVYGDGSQHASIYQVGLHFTKGRAYQFYVYLKGRAIAWPPGLRSKNSKVHSMRGRTFPKSQRGGKSTYWNLLPRRTLTMGAFASVSREMEFSGWTPPR